MNKETLLIQAMEAQLAKPNKAVVNSESSFVRYRIEVAGDQALAREYWNWAISSEEWRRKNPIFGLEVLELQEKLDAIDATVSMPSWGTYGT